MIEQDIKLISDMLDMANAEMKMTLKSSKQVADSWERIVSLLSVPGGGFKKPKDDPDSD